MGTIHPRVYRFDASGCNGCDVAIVEAPVLASLAALGVELVEQPEDANTLLVTGGSNLKSAPELERVYGRLQAPRSVVAVGSCAATMGIFKGSYAMRGPVDTIVPVAWYVPGCPPRPHTLLRTLASAFGLDASALAQLAPPPAGTRAEPHVDERTCLGCGACAQVCPADAIDIRDVDGMRMVRFKREDCVFCASCQEVCPSQAITLRSPDEPWSREKASGASEARLPLTHCANCQAPFVPTGQLEWMRQKIDESLRLDDGLRADVARSLSLCPSCRRSEVALVEAQHGLLAALGARQAAPERGQERVIVFEAARCTACRYCEVACAFWHHRKLDVGQARLRMVFTGDPAAPRFAAVHCQHCEHPLCVAVCPSSALATDPETGRVMPNAAKCIGCEMCTMACAAAEPLFDAAHRIALKCDFCYGNPQCVEHCASRALRICDRSEAVALARAAHDGGTP